MATLDFTPLFRSSIGFDQLPSLLPMRSSERKTGYPPYNIEKVGEDQYRIVMAVAGFGRDDVEIIQEQNRLTVRGKLKLSDTKIYLHHGIATRSFERRFDLADYVEITDASMGEGLLVIALKRELPEALKSRSIPINAGTFVPLGRKVSGKIEATADTQRAA
jgi:molecular chaperone IbpA